MSYYVIIRGPLGIGKSTIAKKLAQSLQGEYVSIDSVLELQGLDKVKGKSIPAKNFIKANEMILPEVQEKLKAGKVVVFDGNFYHQEQIDYLVKNLPGKLYAFTLTAPLEICIQRDAGRKKSYGSDAASAVYFLVSRFNYGIIINTKNKTVEQILEEITTYLPKK